jgi:hypothetical protein
LRIESGAPVWIDPEALQAAIVDEDTRAGLAAVAGAALRGGGAVASASPLYLRPYHWRAPQGDGAGEADVDQRALPTLGVWGTTPAQ